MKTFQTISVIVFVGVVSFITYNLINDSRREYYSVIQPVPRLIEDKMLLSGFVYPSKEIDIKPQVSGIINEVFVTVGSVVKEGDPIASVNLVPNASEIENLTSAVRMASINLNTAKTHYERQKNLFDNKAISRSDYEQAEKEFLSAQENYSSAENQLNLRQRGNKIGNNIVRASTSGTIIDIPVKPGTSVVERSIYNTGTTVAIISSSDNYVFKASVPERNIRYLDVGEIVKLKLLAYDSLSIDAVIMNISAKGELEGGAVKFPIEAEFSTKGHDIAFRSGYSATGEILLSSKYAYITVPEKCIHFRGDSSFVYVTDSLMRFSNIKIVSLGVSDGEVVEIIEGLSVKDRVITNYHD